MAAGEGWSRLLLDEPTVAGVESIEVGYAKPGSSPAPFRLGDRRSAPR